VNRGEGAAVTPLYEDMVHGTRETLAAFGGAVIFVLLIGCANVVLSILGGALGVLLAVWGMPLQVRTVPVHTAFSTRLAMGASG
jgi:hypothetical protein